jgi:flagellar assembly protein FliH
MTTKTTWFDKHTVHVRRIAWSGQAASATPEEAHVEADVPESAEREAPEAALVPAEALEASEQVVAVKTAEVGVLTATVAALRGELDAAHAMASEARQALAEVTERTLEDAESELVKLALAIAERIVGRELATSPELIIGWAREALAASTLGEGLVVAVSADVASAVDPEHWEELAPRLIADASLPPSTCELRDGTTTVVVGGGDRLDLAAAQLAAVPARAA